MAKGNEEDLLRQNIGQLEKKTSARARVAPIFLPISSVPFLGCCLHWNCEQSTLQLSRRGAGGCSLRVFSCLVPQSSDSQKRNHALERAAPPFRTRCHINPPSKIHRARPSYRISKPVAFIIIRSVGQRAPLSCCTDAL